MAEYIEREALIKESTFMFDYALGHCKCVLVEDILNIPAVDVVEVVRCKDCKHFKSNERASERFGCGRCIRNSSFEPLELSTVMDCDFCSYGERRCDNG